MHYSSCSAITSVCMQQIFNLSMNTLRLMKYIGYCVLMKFIKMQQLTRCIVHNTVGLKQDHQELYEGRQKRSGCSGFDRTSFSQGEKIKVHFYKKQVIKKSASVILGLGRLILLGYNGCRRHMKRCMIIGRPRIMLTRYSAVQKAK